MSAAAVGAAGVPVNVGDETSAFSDKSSVVHEAVEPSVLRYFPLFPVCVGRLTTALVVTEVTLPFESTAITGIADAEPYVAAVTPEFARVRLIDVSPEPDASPETVTV